MSTNRLLECSICRTLATDVAATKLGWRLNPANPSTDVCRDCLAQGRSGAGRMDAAAAPQQPCHCPVRGMDLPADDGVR
jgi:hypothetical protein